MLTALVVSLSLASSPPMKEALASLATVQPLLASPEAFRDPANRASVMKALETLARLEHPFVRSASTSSDNVARLFGRQLAAAKAEFERGRTESARYRAQTVSQLCIGCHVREPAADFADAEKVAAGLKLPPLQQAQFFATTRQLDRALELWKVELAKPVKLEPQLFEQLDALRLALRVTVPMRDDARLVRALLVPQLTRKDLPEFVRNELVAWERDAKAWEAERFVAAGKSAPELVAKAKALVAAAQAERVVTAQPMHLIKLLRAASYLDEALRREPAGALRGEVLYLLGVVHATVVDAPLWELEWMYLEACIREFPRTALARTCGARLKSRTFVIWNANRDIPADAWTAMSELMALTLPEGEAR
jgi:hypothetical protein